MPIWDIFLWLLVGILAFLIGISTVREKLTESMNNNQKSSKKELVTSIEFPKPPVLQTNNEDNVLELPSSEQEAEEKTVEINDISEQIELVTIACPGCDAEMEVPELAAPQLVKCDACGLSGEFEL